MLSCFVKCTETQVFFVTRINDQKQSTALTSMNQLPRKLPQLVKIAVFLVHDHFFPRSVRPMTKTFRSLVRVKEHISVVMKYAYQELNDQIPSF